MHRQSAISVIVASLLITACVPPGPGPGMVRPMPYGYSSGAMPPAHWDCNGGCDASSGLAVTKNVQPNDKSQIQELLKIWDDAQEEAQAREAQEYADSLQSHANQSQFDMEKLSKAMLNISVGDSASTIVERFQMSCRSTACDSKDSRFTWVGPVKDVYIEPTAGPIKMVAVGYSSGDFDQLFSLVHGLLGEPKRTDVEPEGIVLAGVTLFEWNVNNRKLGLIKYYGRSINIWDGSPGESLDGSFTISVITE